MQSRMRKIRRWATAASSIDPVGEGSAPELFSQNGRAENAILAHPTDQWRDPSRRFRAEGGARHCSDALRQTRAHRRACGLRATACSAPARCSSTSSRSAPADIRRAVGGYSIHHHRLSRAGAVGCRAAGFVLRDHVLPWRLLQRAMILAAHALSPATLLPLRRANEEQSSRRSSGNSPLHRLCSYRRSDRACCGEVAAGPTRLVEPGAPPPASFPSYGFSLPRLFRDACVFLFRLLQWVLFPSYQHLSLFLSNYFHLRRSGHPSLIRSVRGVSASSFLLHIAKLRFPLPGVHLRCRWAVAAFRSLPLMSGLFSTSSHCRSGPPDGRTFARYAGEWCGPSSPTPSLALGSSREILDAGGCRR